MTDRELLALVSASLAGGIAYSNRVMNDDWAFIVKDAEKLIEAVDKHRRQLLDVATGGKGAR